MTARETEGGKLNSTGLRKIIVALALCAVGASSHGMPKIACQEPVYNFGTVANTSPRIRI